MDILATPVGVPVPAIDGEVFPLVRENIGEIGIIDADYPGAIDTMMGMVKEAIFTIAGIDPTLNDEEWYAEWVALMTVLQFSDAIHVLRDARNLSAQLQSEEAPA